MLDDTLDPLKRLRPKTLLEQLGETLTPDYGIRSALEQLDHANSRSALSRVAEETERDSFASFTEKLRKQLAEGTVGGLGVSQLLMPRIGSVVEQLQLGGAFAQADAIGRATDGFWLAEIQRKLRPLGEQQDVIGAALNALRPLSRQEDFHAYLRGIVEQLREAGPEVQKEAEAASERLATRALAEPTPESAYRKFLELLGYLTPIQQFLVRLITSHFFQGLVLLCIAPVADHYEKKWLQDSPQGQLKQANARVVQEVGGTLVLADFRMVIAQPRLVVRESPAAAGKPMGALEFGTAVRVVRKDDAFSLVEWRGEGETVLTGWVFSRYLKPFK